MNRKGKSMMIPFFECMAAMYEHDGSYGRKRVGPKVEIDTAPDYEKIEKAKAKRAMRNAKRLKQRNR